MFFLTVFKIALQEKYTPNLYWKKVMLQLKWIKFLGEIHHSETNGTQAMPNEFDDKAIILV